MKKKTQYQSRQSKANFHHWVLREQMIQVLRKLFLNTEKQGNYPVLFFLNKHDNNSEILQLNQNCNHSQEYWSKNAK